MSAQPEPSGLYSYDPGPMARSRWRAILGALVVVGGIFLLLPVIHWFGDDRVTPEPPARTIEVMRQPPPPAQDETDRELAAQSPEPMLADSDVPPSELPLQPLNIAIQAGFDDAYTGVVGLHGFALSPDAAAEIEIFEVADLDRIPRVISSPDLILPHELARDGISGRVRLEVIIHPSGRVEVMDVISADHPRLVRHARQFAEQCVFEPPTRGGRRVAAHYEFPIRY